MIIFILRNASMKLQNLSAIREMFAVFPRDFDLIMEFFYFFDNKIIFGIWPIFWWRWIWIIFLFNKLTLAFFLLFSCIIEQKVRRAFILEWIKSIKNFFKRVTACLWRAFSKYFVVLVILRHSYVWNWFACF